MDETQISKMIGLTKERSLRDWLLLSLLAEYGLKTGEAICLTPGHVEGDTLFLGPRKIMLKRRHAAAFSSSESAYVFQGRKGRHITHRQAQNIVRVCSRLALGEELTPNHLRRAFAKQFIGRGGEPERLKKLLGHAHLHTTKRLYEPGQ